MSEGTPHSNDDDSSSSSSSSSKMRIDPARAKVLLDNISSVLQRVDAARGTRNVRLISVSKLKPITDILALHQPPQSLLSSLPSNHQQITHFGENYSQELLQKSPLLPRSIHWHMLGALQTNKCKPLAATVPNLYCVSSVDTAKKAEELNKGRAKCVETYDHVRERLRVLVQVNTSGENSKSGVSLTDDGGGGGGGVEEVVALCRHIRDSCPHLRLAGFMTIGALARSQSAATEEGRNEDFVTLKATRDAVAKELGLEEEELELSMGMSADFEAAIREGSDEVRVGTGIFGERPSRKDAVVEG